MWVGVQVPGLPGSQAEVFTSGLVKDLVAEIISMIINCNRWLRGERRREDSSAFAAEVGERQAHTDHDLGRVSHTARGVRGPHGGGFWSRETCF